MRTLWFQNKILQILNFQRCNFFTYNQVYLPQRSHTSLWAGYVHEDVMLCTWGRYVYEVIMFMRTLCSWGRYVSEDIRVKDRVRVRVRVRHRVSVRDLRSNVNRGRQEFLFSSMCFYILHPPCHMCSFNPPPPPPHTPFHTHTILRKNWYVWSENTMFMLVYAYFMYRKLEIRTLWPCKHLRNISKVKILRHNMCKNMDFFFFFCLLGIGEENVVNC